MKTSYEIPHGTKSLLLFVFELVALLLLHHVMLAFLVGKDVVAQILSGGAHTDPFVRIVMVMFLAVRVLVILLLPGWVALRLGLLAYESFAKPVNIARSGNSSSRQVPGERNGPHENRVDICQG